VNWQTKFRICVERAEGDVDFQDDFLVGSSPAPDAFIQEVRARFPFVTGDYLEFLGLTDGADIIQAAFFGSDRQTLFRSLWSGVDIYAPVYRPGRWLSFGCEAGGAPFLMHRDGRIALGAIDPPDGSVDFIAANFTDFMGEVVMGTRYNTFFDGEPENENDPEDTWYAFLKQQQWA
jgi:hypothetical protein